MQHKIVSPRTNTIYTKGDVSSEHHLYLFHGYAQTGKSFLEELSYLAEDHFLVSIEGMSRFYSKGLFGDVGNSWMTKYEREDEIKDYLKLIDLVYQQFSKGKVIKLLGFSQGSQTAARWTSNNEDKVIKLIMCGGLLPKGTTIKNPDKVEFLIGDKDSFIPTKMLNQHQKVHSAMHYRLFKGKHELPHQLIRETIND